MRHGISPTLTWCWTLKHVVLLMKYVKRWTCKPIELKDLQHPRCPWGCLSFLVTLIVALTPFAYQSWAASVFYLHICQPRVSKKITQSLNINNHLKPPTAVTVSISWRRALFYCHREKKRHGHTTRPLIICLSFLSQAQSSRAGGRDCDGGQGLALHPGVMGTAA